MLNECDFNIKSGIIDTKVIVNYVITKISDEEKQILKLGSDKAADAIIDILKTDVQSTMNKYNKKENFNGNKIEDKDKDKYRDKDTNNIESGENINDKSKEEA